MTSEALEKDTGSDEEPAPGGPVDPCACGHERELHEHYRSGRDCAICGPTGCRTYRRCRVGPGSPSSD